MANPKQASWRGIPFYYRGSTEQRGFKTVQHLYPGSNNFKIEQMGKMPKPVSYTHLTLPTKRIV